MALTAHRSFARAVGGDHPTGDDVSKATYRHYGSQDTAPMPKPAMMFDPTGITIRAMLPTFRACH